MCWRCPGCCRKKKGTVEAMKRSWKIILSALVVYGLLLAALVFVESGAPDASIHSFWDAVWFSLITMTTVGYGDLSPVTAAGRVLGMVFALCSIGILTALIGVGLRLIGGQLIPALRLRRGRMLPGFSVFPCTAAKSLRPEMVRLIPRKPHQPVHHEAEEDDGARQHDPVLRKEDQQGRTVPFHRVPDQGDQTAHPAEQHRQQPVCKRAHGTSRMSKIRSLPRPEKRLSDPQAFIGWSP